MRGSSRAALAVAVLIALWIVVYWRTERPAFDNPVMVEPPQSPPRVEDERRAPPVPEPTMPASGPQPTTGAATIPAVALAPTPLPLPAPEAKPKPEPKPGEVIPPAFDLYVIEKGDTAQTISKKKYGTPDHWRAVLRANPLLDFTRLKPGRTIRVPHDPRNIQGVKAPEPGAAYTEYTVAPGDTLSSISKALYGTTTKWRAIRDANPELDEEGTNLRPGTKLKVPPPSQPAGSTR